jgi:archaellum component FlaF (FlaF/FlaG flagellin family)
MAAVLTIVITLVAGAALFGYVNSQAAISENAIGQSNDQNVNFLNERFVIVDMNFSQKNPSTSVSLWIYNNGLVTLNITQVELYSSNRAMDIFYQDNTGSSTCSSQPLPSYALPAPMKHTKLTLSLPSGCGAFVSGTSYYVNVQGLYGNKLVYYACDSTTGCTS